VHQIGFSLNEYIEMHGQQNKKLQNFLNTGESFMQSHKPALESYARQCIILSGAIYAGRHRKMTD